MGNKVIIFFGYWGNSITHDLAAEKLTTTNKYIYTIYLQYITSYHNVSFEICSLVDSFINDSFFKFENRPNNAKNTEPNFVIGYNKGY